MHKNKCVVSAGRAVLEMMQYDWEPLSHCELDQRLDKAVEEILEAELMSQAQAQTQAQPSPLILQVAQVEEPAWSLQVHAQDAAPSQVVFHLSDAIAILPDPDHEIQRQSAEKAEENPAVQRIIELLKNASSYNRRRLAGRARLSLSHTVLLSLTLLSKRRSYRSVSTSFRLEKGNIHRIFSSFCQRLNALEEQQIRWPDGQEITDNLLPFSSLLGMHDAEEQSVLPKVLGVLGHTCIPIRLPIPKQDLENEELDLSHLTKEAHPDSWLNLELACDSQGRFIHCHISRGSEQGWAGDLSSKIKRNPGMVPPGCCLVAGSGYPLTEEILTPYPAGQGGGPRENLFNRTLESHLCRLDQAVEDLKMKFQRLKYLDIGNFEKAKEVVLSACILRNVFLDMGDLGSRGQPGRGGQRELEREGDNDEGGLKWRDTVAQQLYSALDL